MRAIDAVNSRTLGDVFGPEPVERVRVTSADSRTLGDVFGPEPSALARSRQNNSGSSRISVDAIGRFRVAGAGNWQ